MRWPGHRYHHPRADARQGSLARRLCDCPTSKTHLPRSIIECRVDSLRSPYGDQANWRGRGSLDLESAGKNHGAFRRDLLEIVNAFNSPFVCCEESLVSCRFLCVFHLVEGKSIYSDSGDVALMHQERNRFRRNRRKVGDSGLIKADEGRRILRGLLVPSRVHQYRCVIGYSPITTLPALYVFDSKLSIAVLRSALMNIDDHGRHD